MENRIDFARRFPRHRFRAFPQNRCEAVLEPIFRAAALRSADHSSEPVDSYKNRRLKKMALEAAAAALEAAFDDERMPRLSLTEIPCDRQFVKSSVLLDSLANTAREAARSFERTIATREHAVQPAAQESLNVSVLADLADSISGDDSAHFPVGTVTGGEPVQSRLGEHLNEHLDEHLREQLDENFDLLSWLSESDDQSGTTGSVACYDAFPGWEPLPAAVQYFSDADEEIAAEEAAAEAAAAAALANLEAEPIPTFMDTISANAALAAERNPVRRARLSARRKRALFAQNLLPAPEVKTLVDGRRVEIFEHGAVLIKDALGRVTEVRSSGNTCVTINYDRQGYPQGFVRSEPDGSAHSRAERDQHGVVVRGNDGRVRAQGEVMVVDPSGVLSVSRFDGQFWSLDLLRGLHVERRTLIGNEGSVAVLTGVFASDGFRMMTRFQQTSTAVTSGENQEACPWYSSAPSGTFRFYGRDGSVVQFASEEDLLDLQPSVVCPSGARKIGNVSRAEHQARTAWDSVREYVTSYLSA